MRSRPQRKRIFVGCEGESESNFIALLQGIANEQQLPVHLDKVELNGGDPATMIEDAIQQSKLRARKRGAYVALFALLDTDKLGENPARERRAKQSATDESLLIVWQNTCHEALLLRHLDGRLTSRPPTTKVANDQIKRNWPKYRKPMPARQLAVRLSTDAVKRVAARDDDYGKLIKAIGLI